MRPLWHFLLRASLPLVLVATGCGDPAAAQPLGSVHRTVTLRTTTPQRTDSPDAQPWRPPHAVEKKTRVAAAPPPGVQSDERALFVEHCGACHGNDGRGDGALGEALFPPPRDFAHGGFKVRSTTRGMPSDEDLARTIRRGMPGAGMPGAAHVSDEEVSVLVRVVRRLAYEGKVSDLLAEDSEITAPEASEIAADLVAAGPVFEIPERPTDPLDATPARVFEFYCAECHSTDGTGIDAPDGDDLKDYAGRPTRARNLTHEPLKGGGRREDLMHRIALGMPGTPMPESTTLPKNLWAIADHVLSLRPDAPEPVAPDARIATAATSEGAPSTLPVYPLRPDGFDPDRVETLLVRDDSGKTLRVSWTAIDADATGLVSIRTAVEVPGAFAWAEADATEWFGTGSAPTATEARLVGESFVADVPIGDAAVAWIAVTIRERAGGGGAARTAFTSWHAVVAPR